MRTLSLTVTEELAGRTVKSLLHYRLHLPEPMIARIKLYPAGICCNGQRCRTTDRPKPGDVLTAQVGDLPQETGIIPCAVPLDLAYEDEDLLILNKPAGMATHGRSERGGVTVAAALAAYWGTQQAFHPVNRLDRGTTGLMTVAKSGFAHQRLRELLHTDAFVREYLAIAVGTLPEETGSIDLPLRRVEDAPKMLPSPDGLPARTDYRVLEQRGGLTLLCLRLYTGRTHQIRAHLAAIGCPLLGDERYGTASPLLPRPALHSAHIDLIQPITGRHITLTAPLPADLEALWNAQKSK